MTTFLTTQYLEEADRLADQVAIISRGQIVARGTPAELKKGLGDERGALDSIKYLDSLGLWQHR